MGGPEPSLHRESTDSLIPYAVVIPFTVKPLILVLQLLQFTGKISIINSIRPNMHMQHSLFALWHQNDDACHVL